MKKLLLLLLITSTTAFGQPSNVGKEISPFLRSYDYTNGDDRISIGYDAQYTSGSFTNDVTDFEFYGNNAQLSTAEVDSLLIDLAATGDLNGTLILSGDNAYRSSISDAAHATLIANGWFIDMNGIPITSISYSNTGQTITEGVTGTDMVPTTTPGTSPDIAYVLWGMLPSGMSFSTSTGIISVTPDAATNGDYDVVVTATAYGDTYTGQASVHIDIVVEGEAVAPVTFTRILLNVGNIAREVDNTEDPDNKYWNNISTINGTIADLVDEDNNPTGISVTINWQQVSSAGQGRRPADSVYPDDAWDSSMLNFGNDNIQTVVFSGLSASYTYNMIPGASDDHSTDNRTGDYTVAGETLTLDAELDPPETRTFSNKSPTSGDLTLSVNRSSGELACYLNIVELIRNP